VNTGHKPYGAGRSSFEFVDTDRLFRYLSLTQSTTFLDLGCGNGNYTLAAARAIGPQGVVYGIDAWEDGLDELKRRASSEGFHNITAIHVNVNEHIPLEDMTIDICFMATVLHDLLRENSGTTVITEAARILRPGGRLCIIEFKKIEDGPGPPLGVRLSPEEIENIITPSGFVKEYVTDIGPYHYLLVAFLSSR